MTTTGVRFRLEDDAGDLESAALVQEVADPHWGPQFHRGPGGLWEAWFPRPEVDRFEYRLDLARRNGERELVLDPTNPLSATGAFGDRSVVEFPEYKAPDWLGCEATPGEVRELEVASSSLGEAQPTLVWSAAGATPERPLPLLVVLDGPEFARFSGLLRMLDVEVARGALPLMRAALCHPTRRDEHYTASPAFARYLSRELLPAVEEVGALAGDRRLRAGLGASLGGVALLHAHRSAPGLFGALFLQSGSFFSSGRRSAGLAASGPLDRIERFMEGLSRTPEVTPIPVTMTCGTVERNLGDNRRCLAELASQGYPATLHVLRDAHNWIAWRDGWTPHLVDLLRRSWL